jgi:hypothetical protein
LYYLTDQNVQKTSLFSMGQKQGSKEGPAQEIQPLMGVERQVLKTSTESLTIPMSRPARMPKLEIRLISPETEPTSLATLIAVVKAGKEGNDVVSTTDWEGSESDRDGDGVGGRRAGTGER